MKKTFVALLVALLAAPALAGDTLTFTFTAGECASYRGSFKPDGYVGPIDQRGASYSIKCLLTDGVGAECVATFVNPKGEVRKDVMKGNFQQGRDEGGVQTFIEVSAVQNENAILRVFCTGFHCHMIRLFNDVSKKGMQCSAGLPTRPPKNAPPSIPDPSAPFDI